MSNFFICSELKSPTVHLIREIYDGENAMDTFIAELDRALISQYDYIIIEPSKLGDETSRWINVGNCLHQTAVLTGLASVASSKLTPLSNVFIFFDKLIVSLFQLQISSGHATSPSALRWVSFHSSAQHFTRFRGQLILAASIKSRKIQTSFPNFPSTTSPLP